MNGDSISIFVSAYQSVNCGEPIKFSAQMKDKNSRQYYEGKLFWTVRQGLRGTLAQGTLDLSEGLSYAEFVPTFPGVVQIQFHNEEGDSSAIIGVSVSPEKIIPQAVMPSDFDIFWENCWNSIPEERCSPQLKKNPGIGFDLFDVTVDCGEIPVRGILGIPHLRKSGKCPVVVLFHGAGLRSARTEYMFNPLMDGCIVFDVNAHGIENFRSPEYYGMLSGFDNYPLRGWNSKNPSDIYFMHMFLRAKKALDFVASLDEWDGKNLFVRGASQGAWQSFAAAYLETRVSALAVSIPAGADISAAGWPFCGNIESKSEYSNYFDAVNFARKIHVPGYVGIGLADPVCSPDGIYALCNSYAGPLSVVSDCRRAHTFSPADFLVEWEFLRNKIQI